VKTGVQKARKWPEILDSGFRRNDEKGRFQTARIELHLVSYSINLAAPSGKRPR
jgi:hypothetical protein